jgi:EAL domain-containing protein (putative c-di-GMP-specific phosphodiesterase class I)
LDSGGVSTEGKIQKDLADRLIAALRQDGFVLYAQPILGLTPQTEKLRFHEILTRFREEEEKLLPPGTFFPLLEEYGLLPYLDRWLVGRLAGWIQQRRAEKSDWVIPACSINLSADTLYDANFCKFVHKHMETARLPQGTFYFEVSWDTLTQHEQAVREVKAELKRSGCGFTFAGFDGSSDAFGVIERHKPDMVKLHYGIVKDADVALVASEKLERINTRCHALHIRTVAEYVESRQLLEQLRMMEVDFAQGLVISPPRKLRLDASAGAKDDA